MATVKSDAHFVDCDIKQLTPTTWNNIVGTPVSSDYELTFYSANNQLFGIPMYNATSLSLSGDARDIGGGLVGLPCVGHPFQSGDLVTFNGTTNYDGGTNTLHASTSANELVITSAFVSETFTSSSTVHLYVTDIGAGSGQSAEDADGNIYFSIQSDPYIVKVARDGTKTFPFATDAFNEQTVSEGIMASLDQNYLFRCCSQIFGDKSIRKYDIATGSIVWRTQTENGGQVRCDSSGNVYAGSASAAGNASKFASSDGVETEYTDCPGDNIWVDDSVVYDGTTGILVTSNSSTIYVRTLDDAKGTSAVIGNPANAFRKRGLQIYNGFIYALEDTTAILYKLDTSLNVLANQTITNCVGFHPDLYGNIVAVCQDAAGSVNEPFQFYDRDLNYIGSGGLFPGILTNWTQPVGNWVNGDVHFYKGVSYPTQYVALPSGQARTTAYPQDWAHLEGQTVQVLKDGNYIGDDVVTGGQITLDD